MKKNTKQQPGVSQLSEDLTDSEIAAMRQDFYEALLWWEKEEGVQLKKLNFGEELPTE